MAALAAFDLVVQLRAAFSTAASIGREHKFSARTSLHERTVRPNRLWESPEV
jgi:hypothetical protein